MKTNRDYAQEQDARIAFKGPFKIQINSGAMRGRKGDLFDEQTLIETKTVTTSKSSFTVKKSWMLKLAKEAFSMGKLLYGLVFSFGDGEDYIVLEYNDFLALYEPSQDLEYKKIKMRQEIIECREHLGDHSRGSFNHGVNSGMQSGLERAIEILEGDE